MINANEHKKLLAQIAKLEKKSVNYFDVEKEFFLIDSDNLSQVRPRLYGYSIQRTGIYEDDNLTPEAIAGLDGRGCYVYVGVKEGKITIKQDLNGCWGIYLFRHGDYFALSNSFFRLLDHIKFRYQLTVNRDYCHYLLVNDLCSHAYSETAVNEISLVERNAVIKIDITKKNFEVELIDYRENTVALDSAESIKILDDWIDFWSSVLGGIAQNTQFVQVDLSGGFDSRVSIVPLLYSGVDLNKVRINSETDGLHTHAQDFEIATKIAEHYGFKLNQPLPASKIFNYSLDDTWNADLYQQQTFRNLPELFWAKKNVDKLYYLKGYAGELIRKYWQMPPKKFIENQNNETNRYSSILSSKVCNAIETILESGFHAICNKYNITDYDSVNIVQYLYEDTRCRHHFGKETLSLYRKNNFVLAPALDPKLRTVKLNTSDCLDYNLLVALIFSRYEPDLVTFPFDSNRFIAPETIEYAKKINERFPLVNKDKSSVSGGGFFICSRVTRKRKKFSLLVATTLNCPKICQKLA